jgi:hypothetical protein
MADLYVDGSNDIVFKGGDLAFTSDYNFGETVKSRIAGYFRTWLGEWFLDDKLSPVWGTPYFQRILGDNKPTDEELNTIFRQILEQTAGVLSVDDLAFQRSSDRTLAVSFVVTVDGGQSISDIVEVSLGGV